MRTLDLLRNHPWDMQAVITDHPAYGQSRFVVTIEPIDGPETGLEKATRHTTKEGAYRHAYTVLGWEADIANSPACGAADDLLSEMAREAMGS